MSCPLNFSLLNDSDSKISTWSHIFVCDICHCSRTLEENMIRHLKTELHLSATEYLTDTVTMTLHHCFRRSSLKLQVDEQQKSDSIIVRIPYLDKHFSFKFITSRFVRSVTKYFPVSIVALYIHFSYINWIMSIL